MKKIINIFSAVIAAVLLLTGCETERIIYDGPSYVAFSDTLYTCPVVESGEAYRLPIAATQVCDYDRTYGVEIIPKESNAIYGKHYELASQSVTIKAGENVGYVDVLGKYDQIGDKDSLGFALRLVMTDNAEEWDIYGLETKAVLKKICPFDLKSYINWSEHKDGDYGWCVVTSSFRMQYNKAENPSRLCKTYIVDESRNILRVAGPYYDGIDILIRLDNSDPLDPKVSLTEEQVIADTRLCFNTIYGNGEIMAIDAVGAPNPMNICQQSALQYVTLWVEGVGTIGTFVHMFEWISDDEAADFE